MNFNDKNKISSFKIRVEGSTKEVENDDEILECLPIMEEYNLWLSSMRTHTAHKPDVPSTESTCLLSLVQPSASLRTKSSVSKRVDHVIRYMIIDDIPWLCKNDISEIITKSKVEFEHSLKSFSPSYKIMRKIENDWFIFINKHAIHKLMEMFRASKGSGMYRIQTNIKRKLEKLVPTKKAHEDFIYIMSTKEYIKQGLFKIGRSKSLTSRLSTLNTGHCVADRMVILRAYKVPDAKIAERRISHILCDVRDSPDREFYRGTFIQLENVVSTICHNLVNETKKASCIRNTNKFVDYGKGINMSVFEN